MADSQSPRAAAKVTRFYVRRLHGRRSYDIPITQNTLVLVGENGIGKSTIATLFYYTLSRQWHQLANYAFEEVGIEVGGETITLSKAQLESEWEARRKSRDTHRVSRSVRAHVEQYLTLRAPIVSQGLLFESPSEELLHRMASDLGYPRLMLRQVLRDLSEETLQKRGPVRAASDLLRKVFSGRVVFLPTYRRIERDLRSIFPDLDQHLEALTQSLRARPRVPGYVELVEFGMEDVEGLILGRMTHLKESLRKSLDDLTGEYLRDIVRRQHKNVDSGIVSTLAESTLEPVLDRIGEDILSEADKNVLRDAVRQWEGRGANVTEDQRTVLYFLWKVAAIHAEQGEREAQVRKFVAICNEYLVDKRVEFDNKAFSVSFSQDVAEAPGGEPRREPLDMRMLSSGEKQIVSLFAHLLLTDTRDYFVVMDEPELSLSVPWQRKFLPDVLTAGTCTGLLAVTHSPFICENALAPSMHSLVEFMSQ